MASIAAQTTSPFEVIVIDNASDISLTPDHLSYPVRIIRNDQVRTVAENRNLGWSHALGDIVCFLDDDDWFEPSRIEDAIRAFEETPDADFSFGRTIHRGEDGNTIVSAFGPVDLSPYLHYRYIHCNALTVCNHLKENIKFNVEMETYEDVEFIGRLLRDYKGVGVDTDHAVWNRDNRPDRITRRDLPRAYRNTMRLYSEFSREIDQDRNLTRYYHRRIALLALYMLRFDIFLRSATRYMRSAVRE